MSVNRAHQVAGDITVWPPLPTYYSPLTLYLPRSDSKLHIKQLLKSFKQRIPFQSQRLTLHRTIQCDCLVNCALNQVLGCQLLTLHIKLSTSTLTLNFYQSLPFKGKPFVNCTGPALLAATRHKDLNEKTRECSSHSPDLCVHLITIEMMVSGCILRP